MNFNELIQEQLTASHIDDNSNMDNTESWTSLAHIILMIFLEEYFHIKLTTDEMVETISIKKIKSILANHKINLDVEF